MHSYRFIAVLFALLAATLDGLSMWMMHLSGVTQGATESGQWALGNASMAVHLGLAVCGLAMFIARSLPVSIICGVLMLTAAACSAWQIAGFLAAEVISVDMAREQAEVRQTQRNAAAIELAKEQQKTQASLIAEELKWSRGTSREVDGRRERKDLAETRAKMIAEAGKVQLPSVTEQRPTPVVQSNPLGPWLAAKFGYDKMTMQAAPLLMISLVMLIMSVLFWPLSSWFASRAKQHATQPAASYFWRRPANAVIATLAPTAPPAVEAEPPVAAITPQAEPQRLLAAPEAAAAPIVEGEPEPARVLPSQLKRPPRQAWRHAISPEARSALDEVDFPQAWMSGALRPKLPPKTAAARFAVWLKAVGLNGQHKAVELGNHYLDFAEQDHREPTGYNQMVSVLEARGNGVNKTTPIVDGQRTTVYVVAAGKFKAKAEKAPVEVAEPERLGHLTPSKQAEHLADRAQLNTIAEQEGPVARRRPFGVSPAASGSLAAARQTQPERGEPAWLHEQGKVLRRWRLDQRRRQRGVRAGRRVA